MSAALVSSAGLVVIRHIDSSNAVFSFRGGTMLVLAVAALLAACAEKPPPRSITEFMDDSIAREGTLVRCNSDREATVNDPECINARRAAAATAAQDDAGKRPELEAQSETRLLAARQRYEAQQAAVRRAVVAAEVEEKIAYESQWADVNGDRQDVMAVITPPVSQSPTLTGSAASAATLEPVALPKSVRPPLTTIGLPRGVKPLEYIPTEPKLEEIVVPRRAKPTN